MKNSNTANKCQRMAKRRPVAVDFGAVDRAVLPTMCAKGPVKDVRFNPETRRLELVYEEQ